MKKFQTTFKKKSLSYILLDIFSAVLITIIFIPQFRSLSIYNYLFLGIEMAWIFVALLTQPRFFLGGDKYFRKSFVLCLITILVPLAFSVEIIANRYSTYLSVPLFYWIFSYNAAYRDALTNNRLAIFSLMPIIYTSIQTIRELILSPYAARLIKTSGDESVELWTKGVSGYQLVYAVVIILLTIVPFLNNIKKIKIKLRYSVLLVSLAPIFIALILLANYLTALVVTVGGFLLYFLLYSSRKYLLVLILPLAIIFFLERSEISILAIESIMTLTPDNGRVNNALREARDAIVQNRQASNIDTRSETREASLQLFSEYPIGGYVLEVGGDSFDLENVGQHSYFLDTYALFGVFIGTFAVWIMWQPFGYRIKRKFNYKLRVYSIVVGICFMSLLFNNNLTPSMGFAAFFLFPTAFDYLRRRIYG